MNSYKQKQGRPKGRNNHLFGPTPYQAEKIVSTTTFLLCLCSKYAMVSEMPTVHETTKALKNRLAHECDQIRKARARMEKLSKAYNQFIDSRKEVEERYERVQRIVGLLGPDEFVAAMKEDITDVIGETVEVVPSAPELRDELVLWEAIELYLSTKTEAKKITDIQNYMDIVGIGGVTTQAIESALRTHPKTFKVRKKGKHRYISLKGG